MNLRIYLDGEFTSEEHNAIERATGEIYIKWENNFLPITGDYIDLNNFVDGLPDFVSEGTWQVDHRTFEDKDTVSLYLMFN